MTVPFVFYGGNDFEPRIATAEKHFQIQLSYSYNGENVVTKRMSTNFLNAESEWERMEGDG